MRLASTAHVVIRKRVALFFVLFTMLLSGLGLRLVYLQGYQNEWLTERAEDQRIRLIPVEAKRGTIYDRNGKILAESVSALSVYAIPAEVENITESAAALAAVLNLDAEKIAKKLARRQSFVWLARRVDTETADAVRALRLAGVDVSEESRRTYPNGQVGAHILGFVGADNQGLDGIELTMNRYLLGTGGGVVAEYDASGKEIPYAPYRYEKPTVGQDVYLTLDLVLQQLAERELARVVEETGAKGGSILLMDPRSGEVLAMANRPTYDPNQFGEYPASSWRNIGVTNTYEPGSTFKVLTTAAALNEGVVTVDDRFFDGGDIEVQGRRIHCWKHGGHGSVSFREVVEGSCNVGFVGVGLRLGAERFYPYLRLFGLGCATGISLPGEATGIMIPEAKAVPINLATMAMGQSIAVTPIQLLSAVSAAINGGIWHEPRIVREVRDASGGVVESFASGEGRRVIREEVSAVVRELLEGVVANGTGKNGALEGYRVGGKTGTAQKVGAGGYMQGKYIASFVGFLPADAPELAMLVVIDEPTGMYYGGQIAAPVFPALMKDAVDYYKIARTEVSEKEEVVSLVDVPDVVGREMNDGMRLLAEAELTAECIGEGIITAQVPSMASQVPKGTKVLLYLKSSRKNE